MAAAMMIGVVVAASPDHATHDSTSAARATLLDFAALAANATTALAPGQYAYTETTSPEGIAGSFPTAKGNVTVLEYANATTQTWVASDGSGRSVTTVDPTPHFFTAADRAAWIAAGRPPAPVPPTARRIVQTFSAGTAAETNTQVHLYEVSALPTDVSALYAVLASSNPGTPAAGKLPPGISQLDDITACDYTACVVFQRASALLQGPAVGMTPALRSALFQVLARVPGATLVGTTTIHGSPAGTGIRFTVHHPAQIRTNTCMGDGFTVRPGPAGPGGGITYSVPASTMTYTVLVDPATTRIVATGEGFTPATWPASPDPCPSAFTHKPGIGYQLPTWTIMASSAVVNSDTATGGH